MFLTTIKNSILRFLLPCIIAFLYLFNIFNISSMNEEVCVVVCFMGLFLFSAIFGNRVLVKLLLEQWVYFFKNIDTWLSSLYCVLKLFSFKFKSILSCLYDVNIKYDTFLSQAVVQYYYKIKQLYFFGRNRYIFSSIFISILRNIGGSVVPTFIGKWLNDRFIFKVGKSLKLYNRLS